MEAAYTLLAAHGYGGTSMLRVARAAQASNETLYRWYGNKDGLFRAMVEANAAETRALLQAALAGDGAPRTVLARLAPAFLRMLLGERAVLLNRAAAADPSGQLGAAIAAGGRDSVRPLIERLMAHVGPGSGLDPATLTDWFLALLVGDRQIRRVIHTLPAPSDTEIAAQAEAALAAFWRLAGGTTPNGS